MVIFKGSGAMYALVYTLHCTTTAYKTTLYTVKCVLHTDTDNTVYNYIADHTITLQIITKAVCNLTNVWF